jgi:S1/P1 Nuclease
MHLSIRITLALGAVAVAIPFSPAWPWGSDGHRTIGMVADLLLQNAPASRDAVSQILGGISLSEASVFADCAEGWRACQRPLSADEQDYVQHNPQHRSFHYTDVAIQQRQYQLGTAGTRGDDVVQIAKQSVNILRNRAPNQGPAALSKRQALWVLAHMVGDLHQPLHVGALYFDRDCEEPVDPNVVGAGLPGFGIGSTVVSTHGGNDLKMPNGDSFHVRYWDEGTVRGAMRLQNSQTIADFAQAIINRPPVGWKTTGDPESWPAQWATEILPIAESALTEIEIGDATKTNSPGKKPTCTWPVTLPRAYTQWANQQALTQLGKAGFRLAAILRVIFEHH